MIQGIIFDCFGVLYGGSLGTLRNMCPPDRLNDLIDLNHQSDYGFISGSEYAESVAELLGVPYDTVRDIMNSHYIRNDWLIDYIRTLRPRYKVGLLSNVGSETIDKLFTPSELTELFDHTMLSFEEHLAKPNPEIFRLMAERMGVPAGNCVMIDDLAPNCEGAEIAGLRAIQHTSNPMTHQLLLQMFSEER